VAREQTSSPRCRIIASSTEMPEPNLHATVYGASIVSIVIAGVFTSCRLISRRLQRQSLDASDWTLLGSVVCCWGMAIIDMWMTTVGLGRHMEAIAMEDPHFKQVKLLLKVRRLSTRCEEMAAHKSLGLHPGRSVLRRRIVFGKDLDLATLSQYLPRKDITHNQQHPHRCCNRLVSFESSPFDLFVSPHFRLLEL
jgi:hypothetical protein